MRGAQSWRSLRREVRRELWGGLALWSVVLALGWLALLIGGNP